MKNLGSLCKSAVASLAVCLLAANSALAGPFGTSMGDSADRFEGARAVAENVYITASMPQNEPGFNGYMLNFTDGALSAVSAFADDDAAQENFLMLFTSTMEKLINAYGEPAENIDPIWAEELGKLPSAEELKVKLHQNVLVPFGAAWDVKNDADDIASAQLVLLPAGQDRCAVIVSYFYKNYVDEEAALAE